MADVNFLKKLLEFDKEHISEATLKKIKVFLDDPEYDPVVTIALLCLPSGRKLS